MRAIICGMCAGIILSALGAHATNVRFWIAAIAWAIMNGILLAG